MQIEKKFYNIIDIDNFKRSVNSLNKRYGVEIEITEKTEIKSPVIVDGEEVKIFAYNITAIFSFPMYKIDGYSYIGCMKKDDFDFITIHGENFSDDVIEFINNNEDIPCYHCGRRHLRKIGHVFINNKTGEFAIFGSTCAKNYFGIDFQKLLNIHSSLSSTEDDLISWASNPYNVVYDAKNVIGLCYETIKENGYTSEQTRNIVVEDVIGNTKAKNTNAYDKVIEYNFEDVITSPDFLYNVKTIIEKIKNDCVTIKDVGIIAWMVYEVCFKSVINGNDIVVPDWEKGHKIEKVVKKAYHKIIDTYYGLTNMYTFITEDNVKLVWFTKSETIVVDELEEGSHVEIKATVKKVDERYKSTVITRAKFKISNV